MDFNELHNRARLHGAEDEKTLFQKITVIYRYFAGHKIRNKEDAQEVVQNALMVVAKKYKEIDIKVSFAAWAHQILKNEIMKYYRSKATQKETNTEPAENIVNSPVHSPDPELKNALLECLRKICRTNPRYARTLNLKYQGYETKEICRKLKTTPGNLHVILFRARSLLKACLNKGDLAQ